MRHALLALLLLGLAACPGTSTPTAHVGNTGGAGGAHELMATLARTACYGWCPVYRVAVYRDGAVEYEGEQYVKVVGKATGRLTPEQLDALTHLFVDGGYFDLNDEYTSYEMTDMPSSTTTFDDGAHRKSIAHYHGDSSAPAALTTIEDGFDQIVGIEQWIGTDAERQKLSAY